MIRFLTGLVALGAVFGTAALLDPSPEPLTVRESTEAWILPLDLPIGCLGWMELPVGEGGEGDGGLAPGASQVVRTTLVSGEGQATPIGPGYAGDVPIGVQVEWIGDGDLAGLAAATCTQPTKDAWLVGGSTRLGSSARLVLVNPTSVPSEVQVTIYGPTGMVDQGHVVSMGARTSESFLIEGVAAELSTLVVHVEADGAGVVPAIQDSRLLGFIPGGSEWIVPGAEPSTRLVIPAVGPGDPESDDGPATVRLMAPDGATASLTLIGEDGAKAWPGTRSVVLEEGVPIDLDVPATLRSVVVIEADRPIVAAAMTRRGRVPDEGLEGDIAQDLTWVAARPPGEGSGMSVLMPPYTVSVVAYADDQTVFRLRDASSGAVYVETLLGAGTMVEIPLSVDPGTLVVAEGDVTWVLMIEDGNFRASVQPADLSEIPQVVSVTPGLYPRGRQPGAESGVVSTEAMSPGVTSPA